MAFFKNIRALGNMSPEMRSNALRVSRALRKIGAKSQRMISNEDSALRFAAATGYRQASAGGRNSPTTSGKLADRPQALALKQRGVNAMSYLAVDSGVYWFDGTKWNGPL